MEMTDNEYNRTIEAEWQNGWDAACKEAAPLHVEIRLLRDAIDKSNAALAEAIKTKEMYELSKLYFQRASQLYNTTKAERDTALLQNDEYRKALRSAAERWCWCKQEELPGNCARCIAGIALIEKPKEGA
jgi:hypothetical protein